MATLKAALTLTTLVIATTFGADLPSYFKKCHMSDPRVSECLKSAIEDTIPKLKDGLKELGLPPIEPLIIPSVEIGEGTSAVHFTQKFKDFKIFNSINTKVTSVKADVNPKSFKLEIETINDEIKFVANYSINGKILVFPISGKGNAVIKLKNLKFKCAIIGNSFKKGDKSYIKITDVKVNSAVGGMVLEFGNLFNGNEELGKRINQVLNENWEVIYGESQADYETIFAEVYKDYMNKIFSKVPYNNLMLP